MLLQTQMIAQRRKVEVGFVLLVGTLCSLVSIWLWQPASALHVLLALLALLTLLLFRCPSVYHEAKNLVLRVIDFGKNIKEGRISKANKARAMHTPPFAQKALNKLVDRVITGDFDAIHDIHRCLEAGGADAAVNLLKSLEQYLAGDDVNSIYFCLEILDFVVKENTHIGALLRQDKWIDLLQDIAIKDSGGVLCSRVVEILGVDAGDLEDILLAEVLERSKVDCGSAQVDEDHLQFALDRSRPDDVAPKRVKAGDSVAKQLLPLFEHPDQDVVRQPQQQVPNITPCQVGINCLCANTFHANLYSHPITWRKREANLMGKETTGSHHQTQQLFHVTSMDAGNKIANSGLKPGVAGMFGPAIYFAETPEIANTKAQSADKRALVIATVFTGVSWVLRESRPDLRGEDVWRAGCDSVKAVGGQRGVNAAVANTEYAIYDPRQVLSIAVVLPKEASLELRQWATLFVQNTNAYSLDATDILSSRVFGTDLDLVVTRDLPHGTSWHSWNEFQHSVKNQGYTKHQIRKMFYEARGQPVPKHNTPNNNAWNEFQKQNCGQGLSRERMLAEYCNKALSVNPSPNSKGSDTTPKSNSHSANKQIRVGKDSTSSKKQGIQSLQSSNKSETTTPVTSTPSTKTLPVSSNSWNEYQHRHAGQGLTKTQLQTGYTLESQKASKPSPSALIPATYSSSAPSSKSSVDSNSWNEYQHQYAGQGLTKAQLQEAYSSQSSSKPSPATPVTPPKASVISNSWNDYQHQYAGQGLTKAQLQEGYRMGRESPSSNYSRPASSYSSPSYSSPSYSSPSYSTPSYSTPRYSTPSYSTPSSGISNSWNAFQSSNAGRGMSRSEMSSAYHASRRK